VISTLCVTRTALHQFLLDRYVRISSQYSVVQKSRLSNAFILSTDLRDNELRAPQQLMTYL